MDQNPAKNARMDHRGIAAAPSRGIHPAGSDAAQERGGIRGEEVHWNGNRNREIQDKVPAGRFAKRRNDNRSHRRHHGQGEGTRGRREADSPFPQRHKTQEPETCGRVLPYGKPRQLDDNEDTCRPSRRGRQKLGQHKDQHHRPQRSIAARRLCQPVHERMEEEAHTQRHVFHSVPHQGQPAETRKLPVRHVNAPDNRYARPSHQRPRTAQRSGGLALK